MKVITYTRKSIYMLNRYYIYKGEDILKFRYIFILCFILVASIGCVCASDVNETSSIGVQNDEIGLENSFSEDDISSNLAVDEAKAEDLGNDNPGKGEIDELDHSIQIETDNDTSFTGLNGIIKTYENLDMDLKLTHDYKYRSEDSKYKYGIEITKDNFVIDGNGHTIDGDYVARLFDIKAKNVVLKNFNIINAFGNSAINFFNWGNVSNCTFERTYSRSHGAVNFEKGGNIINSRFIECQSEEYGGAVYINGGKIENCQFTGCHIADLYGAAVYAKGNVLVNNCNFIKNFGGCDGSIYYDGHLALENCNFKDNICILVKYGYCFDNFDEQCNFVGTENSTITTRNITPVFTYYDDINVLKNSIENAKNTFVLNKDYKNINSNVSPINIEEDNFVLDGAFHTISTEGAFEIFNITGKNVTIKNLILTGFGRLVYFHENGIMLNCTVKDNILKIDEHNGMSVYFNKDGILENCNFKNNTQFSYAVYIQGNGSLNKCIFQNNKVTTGGALYINNNGILNNCVFQNNTGSRGSAVYLNENGILNNCVIANNEAYLYGSVYMKKGKVDGCKFIKNSANGNINLGTFGAGLYIEDGTVENSIFNYNVANSLLPSSGGAILMKNGSINKCDFIGNKADNGGAIDIVNGFISNCNFIDNTAKTASAVKFKNMGHIYNSVFMKNNATSTATVYLNNGGIIKDSNFLNNTAKQSTGALFIKTYTILDHVLFENNTANNEIANTNIPFNDSRVINNNNVYYYLDDQIKNCKDNVLILKQDFAYDGSIDSQINSLSNMGVIIDKNNFVIDGMGHTISGSNLARIFHITGSNVTLRNINFVDGNCNYGAAVTFDNGGIIENCTFTNNTARTYGIVYAIGNMIVNNSKFYNNSASYGGSLYCTGNLIVNNSKFFNNSASNDGGALHSNSATIDNCVFSNNAAKSCGGAIKSNSVKINNSEFDNNSAYIAGAILIESNKESSNINNTSLNNNVAEECGAVLSNSKLIIENSNIINNHATYYGAIKINNQGKLNNCELVNNTSKESDDLYVKEIME